MIKDYHRDFTKVVVATSADGGGSYTETETTSTIKGYLQQMEMKEILSSQQLGLNATARLFTEENLSLSSRIRDPLASLTYEIVGKYNFHHKYYDLKIVHG
jgi:hypothetical protein